MATRSQQGSELIGTRSDASRIIGRFLGSFVDQIDDVFERRVVSRPPMVVLIETFAALGWSRACAEKVVDGRWWRGQSVREFVIEHQGLGLHWYEDVLARIVGASPEAVALIVLVAEITIATCLLTGRRYVLAIGLGTALLLQFLLAGAVNPAVFYLIFHSALGLWVVEQLSSTRQVLTWLRGAVALCVVVVAATLPFAATAAPAKVVHDPALVASAWGTCLGISLLGARRRARRRYLAATIDLRVVAATADPKTQRREPTRGFTR